MTVADKLLIISGEFQDIDTSGAIELAELRTPDDMCGGGEIRDWIVAYLAAHILTIGRVTAGAAGAVASVTEGRLSVTYAHGKMNSNYDTTIYGREYEMLTRACLFPVLTGVDYVDCYRPGLPLEKNKKRLKPY